MEESKNSQEEERREGFGVSIVNTLSSTRSEKLAFENLQTSSWLQNAKD